MAQIKATRMELLKLKRRLKTANRGHKLLKEKRDGLMKKFMTQVRTAKEQRQGLNKTLQGAFADFAFTTASFSQAELETVFALPEAKVVIEARKENVMSVLLPKFQIGLSGGFRVFSDFSAPLALENVLDKFWQSFKIMIGLAEAEHGLRLLSFEIEKTRRRVNGLEYVIIPKIKSQLKKISAKLDEQERAEKIIRLKIKELISVE